MAVNEKIHLLALQEIDDLKKKIKELRSINASLAKQNLYLIDLVESLGGKVETRTTYRNKETKGEN